jgi:hypothetical protein
MEKACQSLPLADLRRDRRHLPHACATASPNRSLPICAQRSGAACRRARPASRAWRGVFRVQQRSSQPPLTMPARSHFYPVQADRGRGGRSSARAGCATIAIPSGAAAARRPAGFTVQKVAQNGRYYNKGWFDHKDHRQLRMRDLPREGADARTMPMSVLGAGVDGQGELAARAMSAKAGRSWPGARVEEEPVSVPAARCATRYHMDNGAPWKPADEAQGTRPCSPQAWDRPRHPPALRPRPDYLGPPDADRADHRYPSRLRARQPGEVRPPEARPRGGGPAQRGAAAPTCCSRPAT